mmetsp:Transcript_13376/g.44262  ORF Transcript_13376/g.44262 Transcript_13376/m.44262 type:complete len:245 (-) Transcript_13376:1262-1996(-)
MAKNVWKLERTQRKIGSTRALTLSCAVQSKERQEIGADGDEDARAAARACLQLHTPASECRRADDQARLRMMRQPAAQASQPRGSLRGPGCPQASARGSSPPSSGAPCCCIGARFLSFLWVPDTISSMRRSIAAVSTAVLMVCAFTAYGSHTPSSLMSASFPFSPSMPHVTFVPEACFARSCVSTRMMSAPQFSSSVRGMTSSAAPAARYGPASSGSCVLLPATRACAIAISVAPPPGTTRGSR